MFGVVLAALSAVTAVVVARAGTVDSGVTADDAGRRLLAAVEGWQSEKTEGGCPSITGLTDSGFLTAESRTDDAWGTRFRIVCSDKSASVLSAGPDGRFDTRDDVVVGH
jgi:hypothetical protein